MLEMMYKTVFECSQPISFCEMDMMVHDSVPEWGGYYGDLELLGTPCEGRKSYTLTSPDRGTECFVTIRYERDKATFLRVSIEDYPSDRWQCDEQEKEAMLYQEQCCAFAQDFLEELAKHPTWKSNRDLKGGKSTLQPSPRYTTIDELNRLRQIRRENMTKRRVNIGFYIACGLVPIDPKTAKIHAPELHRNWKKPEYID